MGGSQRNLMEIITFGRDLYCKQNVQAIDKWPKSYSACIQILRKAGYKDPIAYHICLNEDHPPFWSSSLSSSDKCQYCYLPRPITYYYLSLSDKIQRWCTDREFCVKMTANWRDRRKWLNSTGVSNHVRNEIWDGNRYVAICKLIKSLQ